MLAASHGQWKFQKIFPRRLCGELAEISKCWVVTLKKKASDDAGAFTFKPRMRSLLRRAANVEAIIYSEENRLHIRLEVIRKCKSSGREAIKKSLS